VDATWDLLRPKEDIGLKIKWNYIYPENIREKVKASWHKDFGFKEELWADV
jgi:hypothetical protein